MADKNKLKQVRLQRRKWSIRSRLIGTAERPRLSVFRSDKHIYAQIIDDPDTVARVMRLVRASDDLAASMSAAPPLAQPASTSTMGIPVMPSRLSTLCPVATPP